LEIEPIKVIRHQVYDVPILPVSITEFRSEVKICPNCSLKISPSFPDEAKNTINFGPNIKTFALYQHIVNFTPYDRLVTLIDDFYGLKISPATIAKFISTASKSLDTYENEVRSELLNVTFSFFSTNYKKIVSAHFFRWSSPPPFWLLARYIFR